MFIRSVKVPSSSGTVHEYVRIVESVWDEGRVKQKVIANFRTPDITPGIREISREFSR
jgi:hypothetical protein